MLARAGLLVGRHLYNRVVVVSNIPEMVVMIRHILVIGFRTGLRMMMFSAGVLAVLLACAGAAASEEAAA